MSVEELDPMEYAVCGGHSLGKGVLEYEDLDEAIEKIAKTAKHQLYKELEKKSQLVMVADGTQEDGKRLDTAIPLSEVKKLLLGESGVDDVL